ncbi:type-F conjugative transfer system pilin assembly protein TrbC [Vibrio sp. 2art]|uniref:type-F conjugative transfer system pilin assembly protein TrbC n=1 Tax=Vibrio sp. 2art TaxID=2998832 RepID=UPI0022CD9118|nr:type-F conjugative transfer system pilin assembly protein TrbC [Vibrio sp. 2art]MDA0115929.1 type-F conjugative transfer system pilin assembly protein TrbC [Vibrio sp. 2art]
MLRVLIIVMGFMVTLSHAEQPKYKEPDAELIQQQRDVMQNALKDADTIIKDGTLDKILSQERGKLNAMPQSLPGLNVDMPEFLEKERDDRYLAKALAAGQSINEQEASPIEAKYPIVLVSLSMPESQIKALIQEAYEIRAAIAVRGLIDDDFEKTIFKLKELAGDKDGGILIDPTLFRRFEVTAVPTFVLPLEPLKLCNDEGCPTPKHVKATGSATFQYFLDLVARTGDVDAKAEANAWLAKYGE